MKILDLLMKHQIDPDVIKETQINQQLFKKVMQACNDLDDSTRLAISSALSYAMEHAKDDDFIKAYGTISSNVLLGQSTD